MRAAIYRNWADLIALQGKRVAVTLGIFDGIHRGHLQLFNLTRELAADMGGLPLIFTFRNHPLQVLQPGRQVKFITLPGEKVFLLQKLGFEHVACFDFSAELIRMTAERFLSRLARHCALRALVAGHDATLGSDRLSSDECFRRLGKKFGFEFLRVGPVTDQGEIISSRRIRQLISNGNVAAANEMLVYPYFVRGRVESGLGVGTRLLNTPTANLYLPTEKLLPREGVYAGSYHRERRHYPAALVVVPAERPPSFAATAGDSLGSRPAPPGAMLVEGHVIGQEVSLLGRTAEFVFLQRLRENRQFTSAEKLRAQIAADVAEARRIFERSHVELQFLP